MDRAKHYFLYFLVGAIAYWIPDIVVQWIRPPHKIWISLLTFFVPLVVSLTWFRLKSTQRYAKYYIGFPLFMLLGIWVVAPLAIAIGMIPAEGKFFESGQIENLLMILVYFPMATISMSTYSGSLGGIGLVTISLLIIATIAGIRGYASNNRVNTDG